MRAIEVTATGGPEQLVAVDRETPTPGPGQLLVRVEAAGVNFIDTYFRNGQYERPLPYTPGIELAGFVESVGDGVTEFSVGDRVASVTAIGAYAQYALVDESEAVAVPEALDGAVAASALLQGMTAHYLINSVYDAQPGDTVLVHAGAGGVGLILTQLAVAKGVTVITTVSTDAKDKLSRNAGAAHVLRYSDDVAARVRQLTGGEGAAAVYDGVGADTFEASLAATRVRGTVAIFGAASGPVPPFNVQQLNKAGSLFLTRPTLAHYTRDRDELAWRAGDVFGAIERGDLTVTVSREYSLEDAAQAHRDLEGRATTGSVVLVP